MEEREGGKRRWWRKAGEKRGALPPSRPSLLSLATQLPLTLLEDQGERESHSLEDAQAHQDRLPTHCNCHQYQ